jgi:hypothetical protein
MANQWFRSWHGAPTDPKWLAIGRKCDLAPGMVFAIAWALMDRASQASERGSFAGYDADEIAAFMGCDEQDVCNVIQVMADKGMVKDDTFTKWADRQPQRDDGAAERAKAYREREKAKQNNGKRTPNATERNRTLDKDTDKDTEPSEEGSGAQAREPSPQDAFDLFVDVVKDTPIPTPQSLSDQRRKKLAACLEQHGFEKWEAACIRMVKSDLCLGRRSDWTASIDFLLQPSSFIKLMEGNYDNRAPQGTGPPKRGHSFDDIAAAMHNHQQAFQDAN